MSERQVLDELRAKLEQDVVRYKKEKEKMIIKELEDYFQIKIVEVENILYWLNNYMSYIPQVEKTN